MAALILGAETAGAADWTPRPSRAEVLATIDYWSDYYGVSRVWMEGVALCEDPALDPAAVGRLGEIGIYQFHPQGIWWSLAESREGTPWDWQLNVEAGVRAHAMGLGYAWSCG